MAGRRATVVGAAREGVDLARFVAGQGVAVLVTDAKPAESLGGALEALADLPIRYALGGHPIDECLDTDILYVSPGVPPEIPLLDEARRRQTPISSGTRLFFERCLAPIIGITGSSGKTTTTALTGRILEAAGHRTWVGGNIGVPLLGRLAEIRPDHWVVLELSSFQLELMDLSPHIAAITNITPNHLDRHPSMEAYAAAKANIVRHQKAEGWAVLNADDTGSRGLSTSGQLLQFSLERPVEGAFLEGDRLVLEFDGRRSQVCQVDEVRLRGRHNVANALTACAIAAAAGIPAAAMRAAIRNFTGVPHRLELVGEVDGARFYDDSIATSPERSMAALEAFEGEPIILLAGGRDKHLPMDAWGRRIAGTVRELVLFGECARLVEAAARAGGMPPERIHHAGTVNDAIPLARRLARPGDAILLSPGGTSYDQYQDFEQRGSAFAAAVRALDGGRRTEDAIAG